MLFWSSCRNITSVVRDYLFLGCCLASEISSLNSKNFIHDASAYDLRNLFCACCMNVLFCGFICFENVKFHVTDLVILIEVGDVEVIQSTDGFCFHIEISFLLGETIVYCLCCVFVIDWACTRFIVFLFPFTIWILLNCCSCLSLSCKMSSDFIQVTYLSSKKTQIA